MTPTLTFNKTTDTHLSGVESIKNRG